MFIYIIKSHNNLNLNNSIILYRSQNTLALIEDLITEYNLLFLFVIIILLVVARCWVGFSRRFSDVRLFSCWSGVMMIEIARSFVVLYQLMVVVVVRMMMMSAVVFGRWIRTRFLPRWLVAVIVVRRRFAVLVRVDRFVDAVLVLCEVLFVMLSFQFRWCRSIE